MAKRHLIRKDFDEAYLIGTSGHTWIFTKLSDIDSQTYGVRTLPDVIDTTIVIQGTVRSHSITQQAAILGAGENFSLTIEKGAKVFSDYDWSAIAGGDNSDITNRGASNSLRINGDHSTVTNSGKITSHLSGIRVDTADDWRVVNEKSGKVIATPSEDFPYPTPVNIASEADDSGVLINKGLLRGDVVIGGAGIEKVINTGKIDAYVFLQGDDDIFDNRGGTVTGEIRGNAGNDKLITNRASDVLTEYSGEGTDTVQSSVSYQLAEFVERLVLTGKKNISGSGSDTATINHIHGNSGNNTLNGYGGIDELSGGRGRDKLIGGTGIDVFELAKKFEKDTVVDYTDEEDLIAINGFSGFGDFMALFPRISQHGDDTWIDMGKGDILVLKDVAMGVLEGDDFLFNYEII
jgi:Ca2+-binding RTX toxin-like protein